MPKRRSDMPQTTETTWLAANGRNFSLTPSRCEVSANEGVADDAHSSCLGVRLKREQNRKALM
eukprot:2572888-Pleurochrysis_carterae.AAC.1